MFMRVIFTLVIVVGLGALSTIGIMAFSPAPPAPTRVVEAPKEASVAVLVASHMVHAGQLLRPTDITTHTFPASSVPPGSVSDGPTNRSNIVGALLRVTLPTGGLLLGQDLVEPGDHSYLAAVLLPGERAISIGVDAVSGVAGLVWPGDHVDLILTQAFDDPEMPLGHRLAAVTVQRGLRVIATDQALVRGEEPASINSGERTITLEASPEQAERISIASRLGRLSLSVCSTASCTDASPPVRTTWGSDVSPALIGQGTIHVFNGISDPKDFHF